jgi:hypothetical protein
MKHTSPAPSPPRMQEPCCAASLRRETEILDGYLIELFASRVA